MAPRPERWVVGDERIVGEVQAAAGVGAFLAEIDHVFLRGVRPFLDDVAGHDVRAAIGQVDLVAGRGVAVGDDIVLDRRGQRPGLDFVAAQRVVDVAAGNGELVYRADIDVVVVAEPGVGRGDAVIVDLGVGDRHGHAVDAVGIGGPGEDAFLVAVNAAVFHNQRAIAGLEQDAGAVRPAGGGRVAGVIHGAGDVEARDGQVDVEVAGHVDNRAPVRGIRLRVGQIGHAPDGLDCQVMGDVGEVLAHRSRPRPG